MSTRCLWSYVRACMRTRVMAMYICIVPSMYTYQLSLSLSLSHTHTPLPLSFGLLLHHRLIQSGHQSISIVGPHHQRAYPRGAALAAVVCCHHCDAVESCGERVALERDGPGGGGDHGEREGTERVRACRSLGTCAYTCMRAYSNPHIRTRTGTQMQERMLFFPHACMHIHFESVAHMRTMMPLVLLLTFDQLSFNR